MSVSTYVLCTTPIPPRIAWQAAIEEQHYAYSLKLGADTPGSGGWPAELDGSQAGFETYDLEPPEWHRLPNLPDNKSFVSGVSFVTHSDMNEFLAAILTAVALARNCEGVVYDPQGSRTYMVSEMDGLIQETTQFAKLFYNGGRDALMELGRSIAHKLPNKQP
jgi:hypothetical protein